MRIKVKQMILIIVVSAVVYLVVGAMAPFIKYKEVSSQAGDSFRPEDFRSGETGMDRAMILETSQSAWEHRLRLLDGAKSRIILSTFDMRNGESTKDLLSVILHKAEEGVQVQILVDGFSGLIRMEPDPLFYAVSSHPNIRIKIYNPINLLAPWKSQGRMHDKYVIVDDGAYILGGRNTFDYFLGDYDTKNKSLDREVLVYNTGQGGADSHESSLFQVEEYFEGVWNMPECRLFHDDESLRDKKRILRALEVYEETGEPMSRRDRRGREKPDRYQALYIGLNFRDRADLRERIDRRVDEMVRRGLLQEVQALLDGGLPRDATALQAIGYKQFLAVADGTATADQAVEEVKLRSRQYAKRQLTWLRRNPAIHWIYWGKEPDFPAALQNATDFLAAHGLG